MRLTQTGKPDVEPACCATSEIILSALPSVQIRRDGLRLPNRNCFSREKTNDSNSFLAFGGIWHGVCEHVVIRRTFLRDSPTKEPK
jgi:hypothetical protein